METNLEFIRACRHGDLPYAQTLVHIHGARVNAADPETGTTPLHELCFGGHLAMLQWFMEWTALMASCSTAQQQEENDENYIVPNDDKYDSPLIAPSVLHLLQAVDTSGNTPLHYASANGHGNIIRVLAEAVVTDEQDDGGGGGGGAAWAELLSIRNVHGRTPADWARHVHKSYIAKQLESWTTTTHKTKTAFSSSSLSLLGRNRAEWIQ